MSKTKIKIVGDLYFLSKWSLLLTFVGCVGCILFQSIIYKVSVSINWWGTLLIFCVFFYLPSALILGKMISKHKNALGLHRQMYKDINGVKKLFWKIYVLPFVLTAFNINLFVPEILEKDMQGLGIPGDVVWNDYRFYKKDQLSFKNNEWCKLNFIDQRGIRQNTFGIFKHRHNRTVIVTLDQQEISWPQVEIESKLKSHYPLLDF